MIIDEFSIFSLELLEKIESRLRQAKGRRDVPFGGVRVILVGDPGQLLSVDGTPLYGHSDKPFMFALAAIGFGNVIHLTALILLLSRHFENLAGPIIYTYILLWIVLSIAGYLYKIVPFLWWTYKYSKDIGKTKVPTLKEMMNEKIISPTFFLFIVNVFIVFFAIIFKQTIFFTIGQFLLSITFIIFAISIVKVLKK